MCNLFNALDLSKSLGYTHFQRIEVDDLFNDDGYEFMKSVPKLLNGQDKKALFYFNDDDLSFHYFYSEIDFFINSVHRVNDEDSYRSYLRNNGFYENFKPVEVYMYDNLSKKDLNQILIKNGEDDMMKDFPNTIWNSETSHSTLPEHFKGCTTTIYKIKDRDNFAVFSFNYLDNLVNRKIVVELDNKEEIIHHNLENNNTWFYHIFDNTLKKIKVYDLIEDRLLYEMENKNIYSYIEFD
jgi:hypothetical protein